MLNLPLSPEIWRESTLILAAQVQPHSGSIILVHTRAPLQASGRDNVAKRSLGSQISQEEK